MSTPETRGGLDIIKTRITTLWEDFKKDEKNPALLLRAYQIKEDLKGRGVKAEDLGLTQGVVDTLNILEAEFHLAGDVEEKE